MALLFPSFIEFNTMAPVNFREVFTYVTLSPLCSPSPFKFLLTSFGRTGYLFRYLKELIDFEEFLLSIFIAKVLLF
jgi:hypothetical protein